MAKLAIPCAYSSPAEIEKEVCDERAKRRFFSAGCATIEGLKGGKNRLMSNDEPIPVTTLQFI